MDLSWTLCHPVSLNRQVNPTPSLAFINSEKRCGRGSFLDGAIEVCVCSAHAHALSISASFISFQTRPDIYISGLESSLYSLSVMQRKSGLIGLRDRRCLSDKFSSVDHQMRGRILNRGRSCGEQVPRARQPVSRWTHSSVASGTPMGTNSETFHE